MFENISHYKIKGGTERNFGLVFAAFFLIISLYPLWFEKNMHLWACIIAFIFFFFAIFLPKALIVPNNLWFKLGSFLGAIVSPIIMGMIFFLTVTPTGLIMRLLGKDILNQKMKKSVQSYWIKKKDSLTSMKNQF
ncbi:MAG: hypothetical protein CFH15_00718 [Alphaproteobacteria bacterium MarineAlpha5_Bin5]|nr:MAG: hypothetical protein CFH15_00718 [Alphaproteobacteria bacterium MarineAlpha5_Bin5]PPR52835.1 MAG: hypothetical protein CFH14_00065 [Alphaproteobacteria bacterium MarineAlpha5_Bin4]|tara:strand:- start:6439 stop:6843 length:405 start_codon:yes stop_codon:yes gene_type:complete